MILPSSPLPNRRIMLCFEMLLLFANVFASISMSMHLHCLCDRKGICPVKTCSKYSQRFSFLQCYFLQCFDAVGWVAGRDVNKTFFSRPRPRPRLQKFSKTKTKPFWSRPRPCTSRPRPRPSHSVR